MKSLNLLKSICALQYGTDAEMAMQAYPAIIRPKMYYVCIVDGSCKVSKIRLNDSHIISEIRTRNPKQLSVVEKVKTTIN